MKLATSIVQIIFWLATSMVAVLGYINAKRTIFQPLRTEIFKKQIEALSSALELFVGKRSDELAEDFDMDFGEKANIFRMYDAYLEFAFGRRRPEELREYRPELCPTAWIHADYLSSYDADKEDWAEDSAKVEFPAKPKDWEYKDGMISVPRKYTEKEADFRAVLENPLLPAKIADLIERHLEAAHEYLGAIGPVLEECAKEMPDRYPELDDFLKSKFDWIHNRLVEHRHNEGISLSVTAKAVVDEVREYFDSDNLLPVPRRRK
ncbi:hypothetical protein [Streptomyces olindensis]|uniref:hypothetical protein n=1 Tax=Streptomyces olindensis TaxID=358823 RepID=UPI0033D28DC9